MLFPAIDERSVRILRNLTDRREPGRNAQTVHDPEVPVRLAGRKSMKNDYYKGVVRYRGAKYPGLHDRLVSDKTWDAVQVMLATKARSGEKPRKHHHFLKGSLYCGSCGTRMIVSIHTNRHGTTYRYFVCQGRQTKANDCKRSAVHIADIEDKVDPQACNPETIQVPVASAPRCTTVSITFFA